MRKMQNLENPNHVVTVYEHLILKNFWEYYVLDENKHQDIRYCLVMGFEQEFGDVYMKELKDFVISKTSDLRDLAPARGFQWLDG